MYEVVRGMENAPPHLNPSKIPLKSRLPPKKIVDYDYILTLLYVLKCS